MLEIFIIILKVSLQATIAATAIILIKNIIGLRINTYFSYLLWIVVIIRLLFPILPASHISIFNATNLLHNNTISLEIDNIKKPNQSEQSLQSKNITIDNHSNTDKSSENNDTTSNLYNNTSNTITNKQQTVNNASSKYSIQTLLMSLAYMWASGVVLIILYLLYKNLIFLYKVRSMKKIKLSKELSHKLRLTTHLHSKIRFVEGINIQSPCVFGIIKPTIILPQGILEKYDERTLFHILTHELAHINHFDLSVSLLFSLLCSIHWFNPILWYCLKQLRRDQELCADAYVMSQLSKKEVYNYGESLILFAKNSNVHSFALTTVGITENKKTLKLRFKKIASFNMKKYRFSLMGLILLLIVILIFCTSNINYPKTHEEAMRFTDNVKMSLTPYGGKNSYLLQIHNLNKQNISNACIEIFNTNPYQSNSDLIYTKSFRLAGKKAKKFKLNNLDYNSAYVKLSFKAGPVLFNKKSWEQSGNLKRLDKTAQLNGWTAASDKEIQEFIDEKNINAIAINRIYDFYTIIMFESGSSRGYYEVYKDSKRNELCSRRIIGYGFNKKQKAVELRGGTASGKYSFVNFKINSPRLIALGNKIEIHTDKKTITSYVYGKSVHTVETAGNGSTNTIMIFDKNDKLIYDGKEELFEDVTFTPNDPNYINIIEEKGYEIINQSPYSFNVNFTEGMFPKEYTKAYESSNIDWKTPVFTYENSTLYLKSITEANESSDYLYATFYFVHNVKNESGNILSSTYVNQDNNGEISYSNNFNVNKEILTVENTIIQDAASVRGYGPGDQITIYLKKSLLDQTNGVFEITFKDLNLISYNPI